MGRQKDTQILSSTELDFYSFNLIWTCDRYRKDKNCFYPICASLSCL